MTVTTTVSAAAEWVETSVSPPDGFHAFAVVVRLDAVEATDAERPLVEVKLRQSYPDQRCQITYAFAQELGFDLEPHYAVDAGGNRFLPGTGFLATVGAGEVNPEAGLMRQSAELLPALRDWCQALLVAAEAGGDPKAIAWPAPPETLACHQTRHYPENLLAVRPRQQEQANARPAIDEVALREQNADPAYMPFNWG